MVYHCAWLDCSSDSRTISRTKGKSVIRFYAFPDPERERERCLAWIRSCGRPELTLDEVRRWMRVCSLHFRDGEPSDAFPDPIPYKNSSTVTSNMANHSHPSSAESRTLLRKDQSQTTQSCEAAYTCCLIHKDNHCTRRAGNASYNNKIQRLATLHDLNLYQDHAAGHSYICDHHKHFIQAVRMKKRQHPDVRSEAEEPDFSSMPLSMLRRYKRYCKLPTRMGSNKVQLAEQVTKHFRSIPVLEREVIPYFFYVVKHNLFLTETPDD